MIQLTIDDNLQAYADSYGLGIEIEESTPIMRIARVVTADHNLALATVQAQAFGHSLGITITYEGAGSLDLKRAGKRAQALKVAVAIGTAWQKQAQQSKPKPLTRQEFVDLKGYQLLRTSQWHRLQATIEEGWADE